MSARMTPFARLAVRNCSTSVKVGGIPLNRVGMGHGGHPNVLQKEGSITKTWFDARAKPEIIPVGFCVVFACGLAGYKMLVVDTVGKPFVERL